MSDLEPHIERLAVSTTAIGRQGMTAHLAGVTESLAEPGLPFFIERPARAVAPSGSNVITWIEIAGNPTRLQRWLGKHNLPIRFIDGEPAVRAIGVGDQELRLNTTRNRPVTYL